MTYIIKDINQNKYWESEFKGFTNDLEKVGFYSYETAYNNCKLSNLYGKVNAIMIPSNKLNNLKNGSLVLPKTQQEKLPIDDVLEKMGNTNSLETNPISLLFQTLEDNHYYPDSGHEHLKYYGKAIRYGETFEENLKIPNENNKDGKELFVKMSIYRKDNGLYELVSYANYNSPVKNINKKQKNNKLKIR